MLQETATRETRPAARELKFMVPLATADHVMAWSRARLSADPHGSGPFSDEYCTTSLYFDTDALDVYHRKGSFGRSKYRIRRYDTAPVAFLERKLRTKDVLTKRRTPVELDLLQRLDAPDRDSASWTSMFERFLTASRRKRTSPSLRMTSLRCRAPTLFTSLAR